MKKKQSKEPLVKVFVYGSLKEGHRLHGWIEGCPLLATGALYGHALISLGAFPAMISLPDADRYGMEVNVDGEIYLIPQSRFDELRKMEERVGYHTRTVEVVPDSLDDEIEAQAFVFADIASGAYSWKAKLDGSAELDYLPL